MKRWITAAAVSLAALLALTACGGPVAPAPDSSQIPSAAGTAPPTEPATTASATTESNPTDSSEEGYGGGPSSYMSLYKPEYDTPGRFTDLADHDDFVAWNNKANSQWRADDEVNHPPPTPLDFIREFNISKEAFTQANFSVPEYPIFTQEENRHHLFLRPDPDQCPFRQSRRRDPGGRHLPLGLVRKEPGRGMGRPRYSGTDGRGGFPEIIAHSFGRDQNLLQGKIDAYKAM